MNVYTYIFKYYMKLFVVIHSYEALFPIFQKSVDWLMGAKNLTAQNFRISQYEWHQQKSRSLGSVSTQSLYVAVGICCYTANGKHTHTHTYIYI
jgi:hypothetical protein